jgi:hypothetical protein
MYKCNFCSKESKLAGSIKVHQNSCKLNPNRIQYKPWNSGTTGLVKNASKGLTKLDNPNLARPKQIGKKFGSAINGHSEETRKKISDKMKGNRNADHRGDRQSFYKGIRMDSKWEVGAARYFDENNIIWKYNEKGFKLSDGRYYYPDFFIYEKDCFKQLIEIKGYFRENNKKKFEMFLNEYPEIKIELWRGSHLNSLGIINKEGYLIKK